ncbi:hypothetical protein GGF46_003696 [Coemansia sp. RSA 552]|nr:hypothetical protein GGF46_003696 [Coemansia sp. RSA 552]
MAGGGLVFHRINAAWECLRDEGRRRDYDRQLRASQSRQRGIVDDEVDLDSMDFDSEALTYSYPCRCSGSYTISEDDLEAGREMAPCTDCSLKVVVLYDVVDDDNEDNATGPDQNTTTASSHIAL